MRHVGEDPTSVTPRTLLYQVFPDRFAGPGGAPLAAPQGDPWRAHAGGTLDGIAARLDHIASLADCLYLTPIFTAPSNHKYDASTFDEVDPRFGGAAAFETLVAASRKRGIGLVLDGVFNHVGETHEWFREAKDWSDKRDWFKWKKYPVEYECWRGFGWMPELALSKEPVREAIDGVVRAWLARGATGWRLDCANDLGLEVCARIAGVRAPDGVVGEVMTWAEDWIAEGRLDGTMNYWFRETVLALVAGEIPAVQAAANLERMASRWRHEALVRSWNVLGSHDTPRLATVVPDRAKRRFAWTLAFTSPGTPFVYQGDEIGMEGGPDPDNRRPFPWDESTWDRETLALLTRLVAVRRGARALREGKTVWFPQPGLPSVLAFARVTEIPAETAVIVANAGDAPVKGRVFAPSSHLVDALPLEDALGSLPMTRMAAGSFTVELPAWSAAIYLPNDGTIRNYRFFR